MKQINVYICIMAVAVIMLGSCSKEKAHFAQTSIVEHQLKMSYKGIEYEYTVNYDEVTQKAAAVGKDAKFVENLLNKNDKGLVFFTADNRIEFFDNEMVEYAHTHQLDNSKAEENRQMVCNTTVKDANTRFYRHINYVDMMNQLIFNPNSSNMSVNHYTPGSSNINDNWNQNGIVNVQGYALGSVPSGTNDNISSIKILSAGYNKSFYLILFQDSGFSGRAIGFELPSCINEKPVSDLTQWRRVGWFNGSWNDQISSYYGYYY